MKKNKRSILSLGLIGSLALVVPMTVAATPNQQAPNAKVWNLKNVSIITQEDVVNLLNQTTFNNNKIDFNNWKSSSTLGDHSSFNSHKIFPSGYKIPSTVTKIETQAFAGIEFPQNFEIPQNIKEIESFAFDNAILSQGFKFNPTITEIKERTFDHAKIVGKLEIPKSVTEIKQYGFKNVIFSENFIIPKNVIKIGKMAFQNVIFKKSFSFEDGYSNDLDLGFHQKAFWGSTFSGNGPKEFNFPISIIKERTFGSVDFSNNKNVVIKNNGKVEIIKIEDLRKVDANTFDSLTIPNTVLKIDKQDSLSPTIAESLYTQVRKNITLDLLKKMSEAYIGNIDKDKLPSQYVAEFKDKLVKFFNLFRDYDFSSGYYQISDENMENKVVTSTSPLSNIESLFTNSKLKITPDDTNGKMIFVIDNFNRYSKKVEFSGFKTTHDLKVEAANKEIDDSVQNKAAPSASSASIQKTASQIKISDLTPPSPTGTLSYLIKNVEPAQSPNDGTTVSATIEVASSVKGTKTAVYTVNVGGFLSSAAYATQQANLEIDGAISEKIVPTIKSGSETKTASQIKISDLTPPSPTGTLTYAIKNVESSQNPNDGTSVSATIEVASNVKGTKTGVYTVNVGGFLSSAAYATQQANKEIDDSVKNKAAPSASSSSKQKTASQIKISDLTPPSPTGTLTYAIKNVESSQNPNDGTSVSATIEVASNVKGTKTGVYTVSVGGFLSSAAYATQQANLEIDGAISEKIVPTIKSGSETKTATNVKINDLVAPNPTGTLTYKVTQVEISTKTSDGTTVSATIEVTSSVERATTKSYIVEVGGFLSSANHNTNKANDEINQALDNKNVPTIKSGSETKTASQIKISDLTPPSPTGILTYAIKNVEPSQNPNDGTTVSATIEVASNVAGAKTGVYTINIAGFLSSTDYAKQQANLEIDAAINESIEPTIKIGSESKTAKDVKINDLIAPNPTGTLSYTIKNVEAAKTPNDGTTVSATIEVASNVANTTAQSYTVNIPGFFSSAAYATQQANKEIDDSVKNKAAPSASSSSKQKTASQIKISDLTVPSPTGTLTYTIKNVEPSQNPNDGTSVSATIEVASNVKGTKTAVYTVNVGGFLSSAAYATQQANLEIDGAISEKIVPTIKSRSETKTATNVLPTDFVAPKPTSTLTYVIKHVEQSQNPNDGTTVSATIEVASSVPGAKTGVYTVNIPGFFSSAAYATQQANLEITNAISEKIVPTIKSRSETKTATNVVINDLVAPNPTGTLTYKVIDVGTSAKRSDGTTIAAKNDGTTVIATVEVSSNITNTVSKKYFVEVSGFTSIIDYNKIQANIAIDNAVYDKLIPIVNTNSIKKTASQIKISDLTKPSSKNKSLSYKIKNVESAQTPNDGTTVSTTIEVASNVLGAKTGVYTVNIPGFLSSAAYATQQANLEITNAISEKIVPTIKSGSETKTAKNVVVTNLVAPSPTGTLTYKVTGVKSSTKTSDGTTISATIKVTSSVANTTTQSYAVEVGGFLSNSNKANIEVDKGLNINPTIQTGSKIKTAKDVKINDLFAPSPTGTLTYTIKNVEPSQNPNDGTSVSAIIEVASNVKGTKTGVYTVNISGFLSSAAYATQQANKEIDAAINESIIPTIKTGSETKTATNVVAIDLVAPSPTGTLSYKIKNVESAKTPNDGTTISATIEVASNVKGAKTGVYTVNIPGFLSSITYATQQANKEIDDSVKNKVAPVAPSASKQKTASRIKIGDLTPPKSTGTLTYTVKNVEPSQTPNDGTTVSATIEVASSVVGTKTGVYTVNISGFLSSAAYATQQANKEIDAAKKENIVPTIKKGSQNKSAKDIVIGDLVAPSPTGTLSYTIKNVEPAKNPNDGTTVSTTIEVASSVPGSKTKTYTLNVVGFTPLKRFNSYQQMSNSDIKMTLSSIKVLNNMQSNLPLKNSILSSSLSDKTLPQDFGFNNPIIPNGVKVEYSFKSSDDKKGEVTIEAKVKEAFGKTQTTSFTLKGFKQIAPSNKLSSKPSSSKLSKGAIIGISIGSASILGIAILLFRLFIKKRIK